MVCVARKASPTCADHRMELAVSVDNLRRLFELYSYLEALRDDARARRRRFASSGAGKIGLDQVNVGYRLRVLSEQRAPYISDDLAE